MSLGVNDPLGFGNITSRTLEVLVLGKYASQGLGAAEADASGMGKSWMRAASTITTAGTIIGGAAAVAVIALGKAGVAAQDAQEQTRNQYGLTEKQLKDFEAFAWRHSSNLGSAYSSFLPVLGQSAVYYRDNAKASDLLGASTVKLSRLFGGDAQQNAQTFGSVLKAAHAPASQITNDLNLMGAAMSQSGKGVSLFTGSFSKFEISALRAGMTLHEVLALSTKMAQLGLPSRSIMAAGTLVSRLSGPLAGLSSTELKKYGFTNEQEYKQLTSLNQPGGLRTVLRNVQEYARELNRAQPGQGLGIAFQKSVLGSTAAPLLGALSGKLPDLSTWKLDQAWAREQKTFSFRMAKIQGEWTNIIEKMGLKTIPVGMKLLKWLEPITVGVGKWVSKNQQLVLTMLKVGLAIGGVSILAKGLLMLTTPLLGVSRGLGSGVGAMWRMVFGGRGTGPTIPGVSSPTTTAVMEVTANIVNVTGGVSTPSSGPGLVDRFGNPIKAGAGAAAGAGVMSEADKVAAYKALPFTERMFPWMKAIPGIGRIVPVLDKLGPILTKVAAPLEVASGLATYLRAFGLSGKVPVIGGAAKGASLTDLPVVGGFMKALFRTLPAAFQGGPLGMLASPAILASQLVPGRTPVLGGLGKAVGWAATRPGALFSHPGDVGKWVGSLVAEMGKAKELIGATFHDLPKNMLKIGRSAITGFVHGVGSASSAVGGLAHRIWVDWHPHTLVEKAVRWGRDVITGFIGGAVGDLGMVVTFLHKQLWPKVAWLGDQTGRAALWGRKLLASLIGGIGDKLAPLTRVVGLVWGCITSGIRDLTPNALDWGHHLISSLKTGISDKLDDLKGTAKNAFNTVKGWLGFGSAPPFADPIQGDPKHWGANVSTSLASGITDKQGTITKAAHQAALAIKMSDFTDRGKGAASAFSSGFEKWAKNHPLAPYPDSGPNSPFANQNRMITGRPGPGGLGLPSLSSRGPGGTNKIGRQKLAEFIHRETGQPFEQCVALADQWLSWIGAPTVGGNADQWTSGQGYHRGLKGLRPGDVLVYQPGQNNAGPVGHVDIFLRKAPGGFWTYDANFPDGSGPHKQWHPGSIQAGGYIDAVGEKGWKQRFRTLTGGLPQTGGGGMNWNKVPGNIRRWKSQIMAASRQTGIPASIIAATMDTESAGQSHAPGGGIMQLTPGTAGAPSWASGDTTSLSDKANILAASDVMKYLWKLTANRGWSTKKRWDAVLQAYNAGPGVITSGQPYAWNTYWAPSYGQHHEGPNARGYYGLLEAERWGMGTSMRSSAALSRMSPAWVNFLEKHGRIGKAWIAYVRHHAQDVHAFKHFLAMHGEVGKAWNYYRSHHGEVGPGWAAFRRMQREEAAGMRETHFYRHEQTVLHREWKSLTDHQRHSHRFQRLFAHRHENEWGAYKRAIFHITGHRLHGPYHPGSDLTRKQLAALLHGDFKNLTAAVNHPHHALNPFGPKGRVVPVHVVGHCAAEARKEKLAHGIHQKIGAIHKGMHLPGQGESGHFMRHPPGHDTERHAEREHLKSISENTAHLDKLDGALRAVANALIQLHSASRSPHDIHDRPRLQGIQNQVFSPTR